MNMEHETKAPSSEPVAGLVERTVRLPLEVATDWECLERMPQYDDMHDYEVWFHGSVRTVRRIGNRSAYLAPGTLVFTDCSHPMQNMLCYEPDVMAWRMKPNVAANRTAEGGSG